MFAPISEITIWYKYHATTPPMVLYDPIIIATYFYYHLRLWPWPNSSSSTSWIKTARLLDNRTSDKFRGSILNQKRKHALKMFNDKSILNITLFSFLIFTLKEILFHFIYVAFKIVFRCIWCQHQSFCKMLFCNLI